MRSPAFNACRTVENGDNKRSPPALHLHAIHPTRIREQQSRRLRRADKINAAGLLLLYAASCGIFFSAHHPSRRGTFPAPCTVSNRVRRPKNILHTRPNSVRSLTQALLLLPQLLGIEKAGCGSENHAWLAGRTGLKRAATRRHKTPRTTKKCIDLETHAS